MRVSNSLASKFVTANGEIKDIPYLWYAQLTYEIKEWRNDMAKLIGLPAYCVFSNVTLHNLVSAFPRTVNELWLVKGFSSTLIDTYGNDICKIVDSFLRARGVDCVLYGQTAFDISNERVKGIVGYLGLLDYFNIDKEEMQIK